MTHRWKYVGVASAAVLFVAGYNLNMIAFAQVLYLGRLLVRLKSSRYYPSPVPPRVQGQ